MKSIFTLFFALFFLAQLDAQVVPNGDFEQWQDVLLFQEPTGYNSTNPFSVVRGGDANVTLIDGRDQGDTAVHVITTTNQAGIMRGQMANINFFTGTGGTAFTGQPDSLSYRIRYKVQLGDTALLAIYFYSAQGKIIGGSNIYLTESSNGWVDVNEPLQLAPSQQPVAYILQIISSLNDNIAMEDSFLDVDYVKLNSPEQLENYDFESWDDAEYEIPEDHENVDFVSVAIGGPVGVSKDTAAASGDYAARIETKLIRLGSTVLNLGILHTGSIADWYHPINMLPAALDGVYKYSPAAATDIGVVGVIFVSHTQNVTQRDTLFLGLQTAVDWTKFRIDFMNNNLPVPDSFSILYFSSNPSAPVPGSVLTLDDVKFVPITSVNPTEPTSDMVLKLTPNPVSDYVYVRGLAPQIEYTATLFDQRGKRLDEKRHFKGDVPFDIRSVPSGYYSIRVEWDGHQNTMLFYKY